MNKQSITFQANEQKLIKTGGIEHYASNIVAYIEATFELGANWSGYDSVRAVWSNDYLTDISTVLDNNGKCIVPTEVLSDTGKVTVNLVGSIADGDVLTDRLTTYPCKAVVVDADAKVEGEETESITPSQFEQFVEIVHDEVEQVTGMSAEASTLPAGSDATASYSDGVLSLGIPKGDKGEQGEQGETGHTGEPAGFGDVTASVDNTVGTPSVVVNTSGPDTAKEFDFEFHNLKGEQGDTGETGATGNGIASTVLNPDYTLTITFTDGTSYTTPSIRGAKGDTGDTGATGNGIQSTVLNADYTLTITFTDGTSYTTPSIRGEQGPAGPVSDVTVNGTSVVDGNGVAVIKMPELTKTVQGNPITIDDAFGEVKSLNVGITPIQDLHGYDKPWSAGAGKNKINMPSYSDISSSPITSNYYCYEIPVKANTTYYLSTTFINGYTANGVANAYVLVATDENRTTYKAIAYSSTANGHIDGTITSDASGKLFICVLRYFTEANYNQLLANSNIQLEEGSTATTYEPYSNICPITGRNSISVVDSGKNLFDPNTNYFEQGSIASANGTETESPTRIRTHGYIPCTAGTAYTFSHSGTATRAYFHYYKSDYSYNGNSGSWVVSDPVTFTPPANTAYLRIVLADKSSDIDITPSDISLPQLEKGTTATDYEPHSTTTTVTLPSTTYGADVDVTGGNGKNTMVLGQLRRAFLSQDSTGYFWYDTLAGIGLPNIAGANAGLISDRLVKDDNVTPSDPDGCIAIYANGIIRWKEQGGMALADYNAYLQNNPITICYELATPTDLQTTPTDITLYNGDNVISSDGNITMEYVQDMAAVIRKIESQL